nr:cell division protein ZapD [Dongshaea marina]
MPALHLWLGQDSELQQPQISQWVDGLRPLSEAIELLLWFWRESAQYQEQTARNGFFQDATESAQMIRIQFDSDHGHYPSVSGNKSRFTIRFLPLANEKTTDIPFELARC